MTITWGGVSGSLRVGIETFVEAPTHASTSVRVYVRVYVGTTANFTFSDSENYSVSGSSVSASGTFFNDISGSNVQRLIYTTDFLQPVHYGYGDSLNWTASISGMYNGGTPSATLWIGMPARPADVPDAPTITGFSELSATGVRTNWTTPNDQGSGLTVYRIQFATDSGFGNVIFDGSAGWSTTTSAAAFSRATTYWARVAAGNGVGWGAFSAPASFTTLALAPSAPPNPTISGITPVAAVMSWGAPGNDGGSAITGYTQQCATDSAFTTGVVTTSGPSPRTLTGLLPSTTYSVRVRATNAIGDGAWSGTVQFKTLPGVHIGDGTAWGNAIMWVGNGTSWVLAQLKTGDGTTWK